MSHVLEIISIVCRNTKNIIVTGKCPLRTLENITKTRWERKVKATVWATLLTESRLVFAFIWLVESVALAATKANLIPKTPRGVASRHGLRGIWELFYGSRLKNNKPKLTVYKISLFLKAIDHEPQSTSKITINLTINQS